MKTDTIRVKTSSKTELLDITSEIIKKIKSAGFQSGVVMVYVPHTTSAITINESADPDVKKDILMVLNDIVPSNANYRHAEGNSAAHIKAALVGPSVMFAVENGNPVLGTWQGVFFCEFDGPRSRRVNINFISSHG
jgi:secondary thiamine-phosphate synthase enzyme